MQLHITKLTLETIKTKPMENKNWPDGVRLKMIEKSKFYVDEQVYQYGFYDGYQLCFEQCQKQLREELIKFGQQFYADEETCIHNIDKYLKQKGVPL